MGRGNIIIDIFRGHIKRASNILEIKMFLQNSCFPENATNKFVFKHKQYNNAMC